MDLPEPEYKWTNKASEMRAADEVHAKLAAQAVVSKVLNFHLKDNRVLTGQVIKLSNGSNLEFDGVWQRPTHIYSYVVIIDAQKNMIAINLWDIEIFFEAQDVKLYAELLPETKPTTVAEEKSLFQEHEKVRLKNANPSQSVDGSYFISAWHGGYLHAPAQFRWSYWKIIRALPAKSAEIDEHALFEKHALELLKKADPAGNGLDYRSVFVKSGTGEYLTPEIQREWNYWQNVRNLSTAA